MNAVRRLFAKKPAAPAPVKRATRLTCGQLDRAIEEATAQLDRTSSTAKILERLYDLTLGASAEAIVKLDGAPPVTLQELDDARTEIRGPDVSASTISALTKVRALIAQTNGNGHANEHAAEPAQYVTVSQLKAHDVALFDAFGWALGAAFAELDLGQPSQAHVLDILGRSASSPERKKLLSGICNFWEVDVPPRTQAEFLRYQTTGSWR